MPDPPLMSHLDTTFPINKMGSVHLRNYVRSLSSGYLSNNLIKKNPTLKMAEQTEDIGDKHYLLNQSFKLLSSKTLITKFVA